MGADDTLLAEESIGVFASPDHANGLGRAPIAERIATRWESDRLAPIEWSTRLDAAGEYTTPLTDVRLLVHETEVVQASLAGQGLILTSELLVRALVARGWLAPWRPDVRLPGHAYYAVSNPRSSQRAAADRLVDWLRETL